MNTPVQDRVCFVVFDLHPFAHQKDSLWVLFMVVSHLPDHLYYFEGKDYSKVPSAADQMYFQQLMKEHVAEFLGATGSRTLRQKTIVSVLLILSPLI